MKRYSIPLLLLGIAICLLAIDQYEHAAGRLLPPAAMSPTPSAWQHRNTDFPKIGPPSKPTHWVDSLTHQVEAYRLPLMSVAAQRLMQNPGSGVRLDVSNDGLWLIVRPHPGGTNRSDPGPRQNMEQDQSHHSLATVTKKHWKNK